MILAITAFLAATFGAISGLGGGVFIMPVLVQLYSNEFSATGLAGLSLSLVLLNALTALFVGRQIHNVDMKFARPMALISAVGVFLGIYLQTQVSRTSFELILAIFMFLLGSYIFLRSGAADRAVKPVNDSFKPVDGVFSFAIGSVASFFGIGGGVLQVPYMVYFRKRSVRQSTATSQVILGTVAAVSLILIVFIEKAEVPWVGFLLMAPAVIAGGFLGSRLAVKMRGPWIVRLLAVVLLLLAARVGLNALQIQG